MGKRGAVANGGVAHPRPTVMFQADDPITKLLAAAEHDPAIPGPAIDADIPEEARALEVLAEHMDEAGVNQATRELFTLAFLDREQGVCSCLCLYLCFFRLCPSPLPLESVLGASGKPGIVTGDDDGANSRPVLHRCRVRLSGALGRSRRPLIKGRNWTTATSAA